MAATLGIRERFAALVALMVALFGGPAASATELRLVTIDVAPWASTDAVSGKPVGVFPEVVAEIERRTGYTIAISLQPFVRIPRELEAGHEDCSILVWSDGWAPFMVKGELVSTHVFGVIARKGIKLARFDDLIGMKVSVLRGLSLGDRFDDDQRIQREFDTDYITGLRKMTHNRLDAVAGALPTIRYLARQQGMSAALGAELVLSEVELPFQCAKGSAHLDAMPAVNQAIRDMRADGTIDRIKRDYDYF